MLKELNTFIYGFLLLASVVLFSCQRDYDYFEGKAQISASVDTLLFDTVFTTLGSATRWIKLYNEESKPIQLDVFLENGNSSFFRINVDGYKGPMVQNVEILPNDSIYVFVEVTINPNQPLGVSPFVIEENLIVKQGDQTSTVLFTAWGQNANYISQAGQIGLLSCDNQSLVFEDPKPYVIYGILVIDECTIVLPKGTRLHIHGGIAYTPDRTSVYNDGQIIFLPDARLISNGTAEEPVIIQGDRLEPFYADIPGQWGGIRFIQSRGSDLKYTTIKNSIVGIIVDSASQINISNTSIFNTSSSGLFTFNGEVSATNCLIHSNGGHAVQMTYGGKYDFTYCTLASNLGTQREAVAANNKKCLNLDEDITCNVLVDVKPLNLTMTNCIISGNGTDEITFLNHTRDNPQNFQYQLTNCIVRVDELLMTDRWPKFFDNCKDCYNQKPSDKLFLNSTDRDFTLDTMSVAREKALPLSNVDIDISGKLRKANPDIGCFEF
jgi:hypothetical protein